MLFVIRKPDLHCHQGSSDQFDLSAKERAQAGATIKKNLEVLGYGE
jgi:hypothetical protein